jgi:hypothetical protein
MLILRSLAQSTVSHAVQVKLTDRSRHKDKQCASHQSEAHMLVAQANGQVRSPCNDKHDLHKFQGCLGLGLRINPMMKWEEHIMR